MFRKLNDQIYVAPQIMPADLEKARELGVTLVVNNRPDGEEPGQPTSEEMEAAARAAGLGYFAVPVTHGGFAPWQLDGLAQAIEEAGEGKLLAYCRSGTRSTLLWALTRARAGDNLAMIEDQAARAGYDVAPVRQIMDALSGAAKA